MKPVNVLFIGDPHFQINNMTEVDIFMTEITKVINCEKPDIIVVAGDILHTHERLHTTVLNKAYDFIKNLRNYAKTYILVGNHDYISNTQFLSNNHWMNSMKEWDNVVIVDTVIKETINGNTFGFVPYVFPGRFKEALDTIGVWTDCNCIFAHQEFKGCKMGAIQSVDGDVWDTQDPFVVSGHIHSRQKPQTNIYYPGTPMQHAFGESGDNIVPLFKFIDGTKEYREIKLNMPNKRIIYMDIDNIKDFVIPSTQDKIRITLNGSSDDFKAIKKTKKFKSLIDQGIKVVFKTDNKQIDDNGVSSNNKSSDFNIILTEIINAEKNVFLLQAYDLVAYNRKTETDDIFFL